MLFGRQHSQCDHYNNNSCKLVVRRAVLNAYTAVDVSARVRAVRGCIAILYCAVEPRCSITTACVTYLEFWVNEPGSPLRIVELGSS